MQRLRKMSGFVLGLMQQRQLADNQEQFALASVFAQIEIRFPKFWNFLARDRR